MELCHSTQASVSCIGYLVTRAKGPSAALAPSAAREAYSEYASRAAVGRRLAAGPFSSLWPPAGRGLREEYRFESGRLTGVKRRILWLLVVVVSAALMTGGYLYKQSLGGRSAFRTAPVTRGPL